MNYTNELGLPDPLVRAIEKSKNAYDKGKCDFSVTELISPARIRYLRREHSKDIVVDSSEMIFSLMGDIIHLILQQSGDGYLVEERFFSKFGDHIVSGKIDVYNKAEYRLSDYKVCSRHSISDGAKQEWKAQLSMNALLMRRNGYRVDSGEIVAIFRDWSKMQANRTRDYPKTQVQIVPVELKSDQFTEAYIMSRIEAHTAEGLPPVCSAKERWRRPDKWALMKKGKKRAVKLYWDPHQAYVARGDNDEFYVEPRASEDIRCLNYCEVAPYCSYFQELMQSKI